MCLFHSGFFKQAFSYWVFLTGFFKLAFSNWLFHTGFFKMFFSRTNKFLGLAVKNQYIHSVDYLKICCG